ncbi:CrcB family protein [Bifidobacterium callitrichos]|uniref:Fluoride-specific ion channel FluC n=1 Tax=Bifidobacterium callitrichos TaxID=762209 RepID=A0A5M9ZE84_9BIFI|nr:CrcB family protein [Bifidobacterium callitrichos]
MSQSSQPTPETGGTRLPDIHADILLIVFCGGTIGTALRYAFAQIPAIGANGSWHIGTLAANLLACFCYAGLTTFLAGSPLIPARRKEVASRGLGMGMCGGLSTMSTLALECFTAIHGGDAAGVIAPVLAAAAGFLLIA